MCLLSLLCHHSPFFPTQPHPIHPLDLAGDQSSQDDPTSASISCSSNLQLSTTAADDSRATSAADDSHATFAVGSDKVPAIGSPLKDLMSDTPNSGSDGEDSRVSVPNQDMDDNFSLKLSPEGSDTASTRLSVEPEASEAMEEKCVPVDEPSVTEASGVSHKLDSKTELHFCLMPRLEPEGDVMDTREQRDPVMSNLGSSKGLDCQDSVSSLRETDQLSQTMASTKKKEDQMVADSEDAAGSGVKEEVTSADVRCDKSKTSEGKQLDARSQSPRTVKNKSLETKALVQIRKYNTRRGKASSPLSSHPLQPLPQINEASQSYQECALPSVPLEAKKDEAKKPLMLPASLDLDDADLLEKQTAMAVPSTITLTTVTPTNSMSATLSPDTIPTSFVTPTTSTPSSREIKTLTRRGRGRPRKYPLLQQEGLSKETAGCKAVGVTRKQQSSLAGTKRHAQQHIGHTTKEQVISAEEASGGDAKKCKTSNSEDDKQVVRRRSLRERVKTPLLEGSIVFTHGKRLCKSSASCVSEEGLEVVGKSNKEQGSDLSRSDSSQGVSPTNQLRPPRRNSSRSYTRSPRKKQTRRQSDEGIPVHRNWLCALCNCGNSSNGLGYLYGPYKCQETHEAPVNKSSPGKG